VIRLKQLLFEMTDSEIRRIEKKIDNSEFRYIGHGDNGRVYKINDEDLVFKITTSTDEIEVAQRIQNKISEYSTFIPVFYVGNLSKYQNVIVMSNAEKLTYKLKQNIDQLVDEFKTYSYEQGGEVSLFDFIQTIEPNRFNDVVINFINALQTDINKLNILDIELDLDFKSDNIMLWNGKLVMIDW